MPEKTMQEVRKRIADNNAALPALHEKAIELGLKPQGWWDRDFHEYAIQQQEAMLEAGRR